MASSVRRGSVGLDGTESQYCDLSGRGLTSGQVDRTLRVFATADTIDLSNNEIDKVPSSIPTEVATLDLSFNVIASIHGIERLKFVQELHLAFNRLDDVSVLEFCPRLVRVNLSGNRLMNTKGIETLEYLENLDVSDNLIEFPEALRALSMNQNLTHLTIRGNPLSQKPGYHVPMLDMIPSLIMLDDKKMRSAVKYKTREVSATKSLSYCKVAASENSALLVPIVVNLVTTFLLAARIYDDKKQFVIHTQTRPRPATTVQPLLPGDPTSNYDGTMFLPPPIEPTHERARAGLQKYQQVTAPISPPPAPMSPNITTKAPNSPSKYRAAPYLSMYDRLAQSNGIPVNRPVAPSIKPIMDPNPVPVQPPVAVVARQRCEDQNAAARLQQPVTKPTKEITRGSGTSRKAATPRGTVSHHDRWQEPQQQHRRTPASTSSSAVRRASVKSEAPSSSGHAHTLDDKQRNVLSVIQNLIQHKRQTLATLGAQKVGAAGTPTRSREYNLAGQIVR